MPTATGFRFPTGDAAVSGVWSNATNVQAKDGSVAATTIAAKSTTNTRRCGNFGFSTGILPAVVGSITLVELRVKWRVSTTASQATLRAAARVSGSTLASHDNAAEPTTLTEQTFDITADRAWVPADFRDGTFEVDFSGVQANSATSCTYEFDSIELQVTYTLPGVYEETHARLRNDDGSETTATFAAALDTNLTVWRAGDPIRVRLAVKLTSGDDSASTYRLMCKHNGGVAFAVTGATTKVKAFASPSVADGAATTQQISTGGFTAGAYDEVDGVTASVTITGTNTTELEFCVIPIPADLTAGDTLEFFVQRGTTNLNTYTVTITLTVSSVAIATRISVLAAAGGDYTSIVSAEAGEQANLVVRNEIRETRCSGFTESFTQASGAGLVIDGWTTSATNRWNVKAYPNEPLGIWDAGGYIMDFTGGGPAVTSWMVGVANVYFSFIGIQAYLHSSANNQYFALRSASGTPYHATFDRCIIRGSTKTTSPYNKVFQLNIESNSELNVINCVISNVTAGINTLQNAGSGAVSNCTWNIYDNTLYNTTFGLDWLTGGTATYSGVVLNYKNNLVQGFGTYDYGTPFSVAGITINTATNLSRDTTSPNAAWRSKTVTFNNTAGDDYSLASSDTSGAATGGTDLSADTYYAFSTDAANVTRTAPWSIGAFEAAPTFAPPFLPVPKFYQSRRRYI